MDKQTNCSQEVAKKIGFSINAGINRTLGFSPLEILRKESNFDPLSRKLDISEQKIVERIKNAGEASEVKRNVKRKIEEKISVNDYVFVLNFQKDKLQENWLGPFQVIQTKSHNNSLLVDQGDKICWYNLKHVKPAFVALFQSKEEQGVVPYNTHGFG